MRLDFGVRKELDAHIQERLATLGRALEAPGDEQTTAMIRGQMRELRLLALAVAPPDPRRAETEIGVPLY